MSPTPSLHQRQPPPPKPASGDDPSGAPPPRPGPSAFRQRYAAVLRVAGLLILFLLFLSPLVVRSPWTGRGLAAVLLAGSQDVYDPVEHWKKYTLAEAAATVAKNETVIACTVSHPYLPMLSNWLIGITRQRQEEKVLVVAEDYATLYLVNGRWPGHAVLIPPASDAQTAHDFGSQGFYKFTSRRPRHLLRLLELGYNVLYNDVDVVWLADPFPYLEGNHDVYFTDDMPIAKPLDHPHGLPPPDRSGTYICSCILFLRPTRGAKKLMRAWIEEIRNQPWTTRTKTNDQPAFNRALNRTADEVDLYLLPQAGFPSGGLYFWNQTWAQETKGRHVIIHNNYVLGMKNKIERFRNLGLWLVDEFADESPLGRI